MLVRKPFQPIFPEILQFSTGLSDIHRSSYFHGNLESKNPEYVKNPRQNIFPDLWDWIFNVISDTTLWESPIRALSVLCIVLRESRLGSPRVYMVFFSKLWF